MSPYDEFRVKILRYLDNDLLGQELDEFRSHLETCADCRANVEAELALSHLLHQSRPLYVAPVALRSRVTTILRHAESESSRKGLYHGPLQRLRWDVVGAVRRVLNVRVLAIVVLLLGILFAFVPNVVRQVRAANYVEAAVATHRRYLDGNHQLELRSSSPELVTAWFADKVPFPFDCQTLSQPRTAHLPIG